MTRREPAKRHVLDAIMRPGTGRTSRGEHDPASDIEIAANVFCSIEPLTGRELEIARTVYAQARMRIRFFVDESWQITPRDYLIRQGRRIDIGDVISAEQEVGLEAVLLCGEGDIS